MINSHIGILFSNIGYHALISTLFHNLSFNIGILFPILDFMLSCQLCFTIKVYKLGIMINSHIDILFSNIGFHALVSTLFHNLGIKVYKHGIMIGSNIGVLFPILDFMLSCQLCFTILGLRFTSLGP